MSFRETLQVARCELRLMVATRTEAILFFAFAVLIGIGAWNGHTWVRDQHRIQQAVGNAERIEGTRLKEEIAALEAGKVTARNPAQDPRRASVLAARWERTATLPPAPISAMSVGQGDLYSSTVGVTAIRSEAALDQEVLENPYSLLAGRLDMGFVLTSLLPLLAIALCGGLLARERESGALALAMSQPLSLSSLIFGKGLMRGLLLAALAIVLSGAALMVCAVSEGTTMPALRLGIAAFAITIYVGFWVALAVCLGASLRSYSAQAITLLGAWVLLLFVIPILVSLIARTAYPTPSRFAFISATRSATVPVRSGGTKLLSRYYEDHPELAKGNPDRTDFYKKYYLVEQQVEAALAPLHESHEAALTAQQRTVELLSFASPALLFQSVLDDLAGTGLKRYQRFAGQVARHQKSWRDFVLPRLFADRDVQSTELDAVPSFRFVEESRGELILRTIPSLAGLLSGMLLFVFLAARRLRTPGLVMR